MLATRKIRFYLLYYGCFFDVVKLVLVIAYACAYIAMYIINAFYSCAALK